MSSANPTLESEIQRLREVRQALLSLHKALLESERETYEQFYGPIQNNGEFFRLVIGHEWFDWLRPISQFIVQIDEALDAKNEINLAQVNDLMQKTEALLHPSEEGDLLEIRYYQAIQRDADIAFMHAQLSSMFKKKA